MILVVSWMVEGRERERETVVARTALPLPLNNEKAWELRIWSFWSQGMYCGLIKEDSDFLAGYTYSVEFLCLDPVQLAARCVVASGSLFPDQRVAA